MAKGQDLQDACIDIDSLKESSRILKDNLARYAERLETTRERIEGAARLHHLLSLHIKEDDVQHEMQKLAEKIGVPGLVDRCKDNLNKMYKISATSTPVSIKPSVPIVTENNTSSHEKDTTTKEKQPINHCECWRNVSDHMRDQRTRKSASLPRSLTTVMQHAKHDRCTRITSDEDDEEDHSKMADSGLGYCDRCEGNEKLIRTCSCQSFEDPTNASSKR